jgi:hypothetical protein
MLWSDILLLLQSIRSWIKWKENNYKYLIYLTRFESRTFRTWGQNDEVNTVSILFTPISFFSCTVSFTPFILLLFFPCFCLSVLTHFSAEQNASCCGNDIGYWLPEAMLWMSASCLWYLWHKLHSAQKIFNLYKISSIRNKKVNSIWCMHNRTSLISKWFKF